MLFPSCVTSYEDMSRAWLHLRCVAVATKLSSEPERARLHAQLKINRAGGLLLAWQLFDYSRCLVVFKCQTSADKRVKDNKSAYYSADTRSDVGWVEHVRPERTQQLSQYQHYNREN